MENEIKHVSDMDWCIALETAIINGKHRMEALKVEAAKQHEAEQFDRKQKWAILSQEIRKALPDVLQPLMKDLFDPNGDPYNFPYEEIIVDGERFGLAPIEVTLQLVPHTVGYQISQYRIFGIAQVWRSEPLEYFFAVGDENYDRLPQCETDLELALARAAGVYQAKFELEMKARSPGEPEYIDTGEDIPVNVIADKALAASVRAIVREEMFNPPTE